MENPLVQDDLLEEIETTRHRMYELSFSNPRTSDEVVRVSTYLDKLLNRYQSMLL